MDEINGRLLRQAEVAKMIGMSEAWLEQSRFHGTGIPYIKIGRSVRYRSQDVQRWLQERYVTCGQKVVGYGE
jgi:predicted DNA-binding transcriptional regulator AlpA